MQLNSPLDQFTIFSLYPGESKTTFGGFDFTITNATIYMILSFSIILVIFQMLLSGKSNLVPSYWALLATNFFVFVITLITENVSVKFVNRLFLYVAILFSFLLTSNLLSMIPYSFAVTSHLALTFIISLSTFIALNINGFILHGRHLISLFIPSGIPSAMVPLLFVIELISYIARVFSLAIRLFANMMSGHTLMKIISLFIIKSVLVCPVWIVGFPIIFGIITLISLLEIAIGFLQAYVFTTLILLYYNDIINLH